MLRAWWPGTLWATSSPQAVHLTFDDGPDPVLTAWVLDHLKARGMTATFFVVGEQARRHPQVLDEIRQRGHALGGHTMKHERGWSIATAAYVDSARQSLQAAGAGTRLFRPPYGKLTRAQAQGLAPHARIVMWDVLSGDYAAKGLPGAEEVMNRLRRHTRPGSIVVFHDSPKCGETLRCVLPLYLDWLQQRGWTSEGLTAQALSSE